MQACHCPSPNFRRPATIRKMKTRLARELEVQLAAAAKGGRPVYDISNTSFHKVGIFPDQQLLAARAQEYFTRRAYSPDPLGEPGARSAVAAYYKSRGLRVGADRVLLTAGTGDSLSLILREAGDPGDRILIPSPGYPLFEQIARDCGLVCDPYPLDPDRAWEPDLDVLESLIQPTTRFLLLISPNNPTGAVYGPKTLNALAEICERWRVSLVHDEVFAEYLLPFGGTGSASAPRRLPRFGADGIAAPDVPLYVLGGISKLCAAPDLKLGWIAMQNVPARIRQRLEIAYDALLNVSAFAQFLLPDLLQSALAPGGLVDNVNGLLVRNDAVLAGMLADAAGVPYDAGHGDSVDLRGGIHRVLRLPGISAGDDEEFCLRLLRETGVYVHPGSLYGLDEEAAVVVSLLADGGFGGAVAALLEFAVAAQAE